MLEEKGGSATGRPIWRLVIQFVEHAFESFSIGQRHCLITRRTPARRDGHFPKRRSRRAQKRNRADAPYCVCRSWEGKRSGRFEYAAGCARRPTN